MINERLKGHIFRLQHILLSDIFWGTLYISFFQNPILLNSLSTDLICHEVLDYENMCQFACRIHML